MKIETVVGEGHARVLLSSRFDYTAHRTFHSACVPLLANGSVRSIEIDFRRVDYLDSAALGMLLLLKEQSGVSRKTVGLSNCSELVGRKLRVAKFDTLFRIV